MRPAAAHAICRNRNVYAEPKRSLAMTAEALKTITSPMKTRTRVMQKIQRSMLTRLATCAASPDRHLLQRQHTFLEDATTMLVILKLVKAGAGGREQDNIAGCG